jgi:hypothetical protein
MAMVTTHASFVDTARRRSEHVEPFAPGWPGLPARWTSSAKNGVGTAVSRDSRVWFTLGHGIVNEVYYPRVDHACTRDLGFIITDGESYFSEEKRDTRSETSQVVPGIPAYRIHNTAADGRYRIEKEILTDPWRDVVMQRVRFVPLEGTLADFHLYVLRRISRTRAPATQRGSATTRGQRCCSRSASTTRWLLHRRRHGWPDPLDSSACQTGGRNSAPTSGSTAPTHAP